MVRARSLVGICRDKSNHPDGHKHSLQRTADRWTSTTSSKPSIAGLRSVGAEVASPWFYLQFGLILAAAGIAWAAEAAIRSRVDMASLAMRWPLPLRHFVRVMVRIAPTAIFAILMIASRVVMWHTTWPSRSYLIAVVGQAGAGLAGDPADHVGDPQRLHRQGGVAVGVDGGRA